MGKTASDWKEVLYQSYVSSGQVMGFKGTPEEQFRGRRHYLRSVIRTHFPADRSSRIVDIACGHGKLLYFLRQMGYSHLCGVEGSVEQVELARQLGIPEVQLGDAFPFMGSRESASAEVVCLFDILEHLTSRQIFDLLAEVRRVLSPGGLCIGHAPNAEGVFGSRVRYGDMTHEQAFTPNSVRQMFRCVGFRHVRCFEDKPIVHGPLSALRRAIWELGTIPFRLLFAAETGGRCILSQNLLFVAQL